MKKVKFLYYLIITIIAIAWISPISFAEEKKNIEPIVIKAECDQGKTKIMQKRYPNGVTMTITAESGNIYGVGSMVVDSLVVGYWFQAKDSSEQIRLSPDEWGEKLSMDCPNYYQRYKKKNNDCRICE